MQLTVSMFREDHAHFVASRPDITDPQIQRQIDRICGDGSPLDLMEYDFSGMNQTQAQILIGCMVCHRLQIMNPMGGCNAAKNLAGRVISAATENEKLVSNARTMKNPYDWPSTACGGQVQQWLDGGGGIASLELCECH